MTSNGFAPYQPPPLTTLYNDPDEKLAILKIRFSQNDHEMRQGL